MSGLYRTDAEGLDECLRLMFPHMQPDDFRTEGGNINMPKVRTRWREQPDMALMLLLSGRFGVCVGKGMGGDAYVGRPGTTDVILTYTEGTGAEVATAELLAVIRAINKVGGSSGNAGVNAPSLDEMPDTELPGMWERADFTGGQDEVRGSAGKAAPARSAAQGFHVYELVIPDGEGFVPPQPTVEAVRKVQTGVFGYAHLSEDQIGDYALLDGRTKTGNTANRQAGFSRVGVLFLYLLVVGIGLFLASNQTQAKLSEVGSVDKAKSEFSVTCYFAEFIGISNSPVKIQTCQPLLHLGKSFLRNCLDARAGIGLIDKRVTCARGDGDDRNAIQSGITWHVWKSPDHGGDDLHIADARLALSGVADVKDKFDGLIDQRGGAEKRSAVNRDHSALTNDERPQLKERDYRQEAGKDYDWLGPFEKPWHRTLRWLTLGGFVLCLFAGIVFGSNYRAVWWYGWASFAAFLVEGVFLIGALNLWRQA